MIPNSSPKASPKASPSSIRSKYELIPASTDNCSVGTGPQSPTSATHQKQIRSSVASNPDSASVHEQTGVFDQIVSPSMNRHRSSNPQINLDPDEIHMAEATDDSNIYICVSPSSASTRSLDLFGKNNDTFVPGSPSLPPAMRTHQRNDSTMSSDSVLRPFKAPSLKSEVYTDHSYKPFSIMSNQNNASFLKQDPLNDASRPFSMHSEKLKPIIQRVDSFNEELIAKPVRQPDSAMFSVTTDNSERIKNYIDHSPHIKSPYYPKPYSQHSQHSYTSYTSLPPNSAHSFGMSPFVSPKPHSIYHGKAEDQSLQLGRMLVDNQAAVQLLAATNNNNSQVKKRLNENDDVEEEDDDEEKYKDKKPCLADNVRASCHQCKCKKDPIDLVLKNIDFFIIFRHIAILK